MSAPATTAIAARRRLRAASKNAPDGAASVLVGRIVFARMSSRAWGRGRIDSTMMREGTTRPVDSHVHATPCVDFRKPVNKNVLHPKQGREKSETGNLGFTRDCEVTPGRTTLPIIDGPVKTMANQQVSSRLRVTAGLGVLALCV